MASQNGVNAGVMVRGMRADDLAKTHRGGRQAARRARWTISSGDEW